MNPLFLFHLKKHFSNDSRASDRTELESEMGSVSLQASDGVTKEEALLIAKPGQLDPRVGERLRIVTLVVSWISVVVLGILGLVCLALSIREDSSSLFAFSLDAMLDCLSSCVVIWRFSGSGSLHSAAKEKRACVILGILFIISAIAVTSKAAVSIADRDYPSDSFIEYVIVVFNMLLCSLLLMAKVYLAVRLRSWSIATDAVNSGIGLLLAISSIVSFYVNHSRPDIWYLDHILGIMCSAILVLYGVWIIIYELRMSDHSSIETAGNAMEMESSVE